MIQEWAGKRATRKKQKQAVGVFPGLRSRAVRPGQWIRKNLKRILKFIAGRYPVPFIILSNASLSYFKIILGCWDCVH